MNFVLVNTVIPYQRGQRANQTSKPQHSLYESNFRSIEITCRSTMQSSWKKSQSSCPTLVVAAPASGKSSTPTSSWNQVSSIRRKIYLSAADARRNSVARTRLPSGSISSIIFIRRRTTCTNAPSVPGSLMTPPTSSVTFTLSMKNSCSGIIVL